MQIFTELYVPTVIVFSSNKDKHECDCPIETKSQNVED